MRVPQTGDIYRHFKGNLYRVLMLAKNSETGEDMVVYEGLYGEHPVFVRSLKMFVSPVNRIKYPDAKADMRFTLVLQKEEPAAEIDDGYSCSEPNIKPEAADVSPDTACDSGSDTTESASGSQFYTDDTGCIKQTRDVGKPYPEEQSRMLMEFLDAATCEEKLEILIRYRERFDDDSLTSMAMSLDAELIQGSRESRFEDLKNILITKNQYEYAARRFT